MKRGEGPLGERPNEDELVVSVAEARIASRLFGVTSEVLVGRYRLLELVGRGGMGVVWGAWDPELERKVAIKLVDPLKPTARERLVDEARALAKLSHPNVVPIYDVGVIDDRVYLVMEWIVGDDLRTHLRTRRSVREVVELFVQAARGLAAVHAAGLVHQDFKPDNAVVGDDGRVRVLDFGLARGDVAPDTGIAGTPRYMAPEQRAGAAPTPAIDQYALCIALGEALSSPVPRWLAAIIARGTAERPDQRYPTVDELVRALGRDPARVWRRRVLIGGALAATAGAFVVGRAAERDACSGTRPATIAADARARLVAHLDALGGFAAAERATLLDRLDDHERRLAGAQRGACIAHARGELTSALYERRLTCIARADASLAATVVVLEHATAATFPDARVAAGALVDPTSCARVDQSLAPLPAADAIDGVRAVEVAIERGRVLASAARPDAADVALGARIAAELTGHAPVLARALLAEGRAQMLIGDERAPATLDRAMRVGFAAHDDATAVEAFARLAYVTAQQDARTIDGAMVIREVANRLGPDGEFARQLLRNNLAVATMATSDDPVAASEMLETAMAAWRPGQGENDYELVSIPQNLALAIVDPARSVTLLARARTEVARVFGEGHPKVIEIEQMQVLFVGIERARASAEASCARLAQQFPHLGAELADCLYEAGWLAEEAGDLAGARAKFSTVRMDAGDVRALIASAMAALAGGDASADRARTLESAAVQGATSAAPWIRAVAADAYIAAARTWATAGDAASSLRCWQAAHALLEVIARPFTARRLARIRTELARRTHDPVHARAALAWYRSVGDDAATAELAAIAARGQ